MVEAISSKATFHEKINGTNKLVVVDFFATWCGPCRVIAPRVEQYSKEYEDVEFYKIDVDEVIEVAQELGIKAMPTFVLFKRGEVVKEVVGANPQALKVAIEAYKVQED